MDKQLCYYCMNEIQPNTTVCPHCHHNQPYTSKDPNDLPAGTVLNNRYLIGKLIGRGGFGATYLALDRNIHDTVAIKEYFPSFACFRYPGEVAITIKPGEEENFQTYLKGFQTEVRNLVKLRRASGIVRCMDDFTEHGTSYMVMEYLEGHTLKELLEESGKPFSIEETLNYMLQSLEALKHVHKSNILHRDISPDNIFLNTDGSICLIDFGSARSVANGSMTGFSKGVYTAPEQRLHDVQGPYTDIYSIGVTMFTCLVGRRPIEREGVVLEPLPAGFPRGLQMIYQKATAREVEDRYQNAEELIDALQSFEASFTGRSFKGDAIPKKEKPKKRGKALSLALALMCVLLAATLGIVFMGNRTPEDDKKRETIVHATATLPPAQLQAGSSGEEVMKLQRRLIELGYLNVTATGVYDERTADAIKAFQELYQLDITGSANVITYNLLFEKDAPTANPTLMPSASYAALNASTPVAQTETKAARTAAPTKRPTATPVAQAVPVENPTAAPVAEQTTLPTITDQHMLASPTKPVEIAVPVCAHENQTTSFVPAGVEIVKEKEVCCNNIYDQKAVCDDCGEVVSLLKGQKTEPVKHTLQNGRCNVCGWQCPHEDILQGEARINIIQKIAVKQQCAKIERIMPRVCQYCGEQLDDNEIYIDESHRFDAKGQCEVCGFCLHRDIERDEANKELVYEEIKGTSESCVNYEYRIPNKCRVCGAVASYTQETFREVIHNFNDRGRCEICGYCQHLQVDTTKAETGRELSDIPEYCYKISYSATKSCKVCGAVEAPVPLEPEYTEHVMENGACKICESRCPHDQQRVRTEDSRAWAAEPDICEHITMTTITECQKCGVETGRKSKVEDVKHAFDKNGLCEVCGWQCPHEHYKSGVCSLCGMECAHKLEINKVFLGSDQIREKEACFENKFSIEHKCEICDEVIFTEGEIYRERVEHQFEGERCMVCGWVCPHDYVDGKCTICQQQCAHISVHKGEAYTVGTQPVGSMEACRIQEVGIPQICNVCGECVGIQEEVRVLAHEFESGKCRICGCCRHEQYADGRCVACGTSCVHNYDGNGLCQICSWQCAHDYNENGVCKVCGHRCAHGSRHAGEAYGDEPVTVGTKEVCREQTIYTLYYCDECGRYMGKTAKKEHLAHDYLNGACNACGYKCEHVYDKQGICEVCGNGCGHESQHAGEAYSDEPVAVGTKEVCRKQTIHTPYYCDECGMYMGKTAREENIDHKRTAESIEPLGEREFIGSEELCAIQPVRRITTCSDCGAELNAVVDEQEVPHEWKDGRCVNCGFCYHTVIVRNAPQKIGEKIKRTASACAEEEYEILHCCAECGEVLKKEIITQTFGHEKYSADGRCEYCGWQCEHKGYDHGICVICNYACPHAEKTDGASIAISEKVYTHQQQPCAYQTFEIEICCKECGMKVDSRKENQESQHSFGADGRCKYCDYCKHVSAYEKDTDTPRLVAARECCKTIEHETLVICKACGEILSSSAYTQTVDRHSFNSAYKCVECGYICSHAGTLVNGTCGVCGFVEPTFMISRDRAASNQNLKYFGYSLDYDEALSEIVEALLKAGYLKGKQEKLVEDGKKDNYDKVWKAMETLHAECPTYFDNDAGQLTESEYRNLINHAEDIGREAKERKAQEKEDKKKKQEEESRPKGQLLVEKAVMINSTIYLLDTNGNLSVWDGSSGRVSFLKNGSGFTGLESSGATAIAYHGKSGFLILSSESSDLAQYLSGYQPVVDFAFVGDLLVCKLSEEYYNCFDGTMATFPELQAGQGIFLKGPEFYSRPVGSTKDRPFRRIDQLASGDDMIIMSCVDEYGKQQLMIKSPLDSGRLSKMRTMVGYGLNSYDLYGWFSLANIRCDGKPLTISGTPRDIAISNSSIAFIDENGVCYISATADDSGLKGNPTERNNQFSRICDEYGNALNARQVLLYRDFSAVLTSENTLYVFRQNGSSEKISGVTRIFRLDNDHMLLESRNERYSVYGKNAGGVTLTYDE